MALVILMADVSGTSGHIHERMQAELIKGGHQVITCYYGGTSYNGQGTAGYVADAAEAAFFTARYGDAYAGLGSLRYTKHPSYPRKPANKKEFSKLGNGDWSAWLRLLHRPSKLIMPKLQTRLRVIRSRVIKGRESHKSANWLVSRQINRRNE